MFNKEIVRIFQRHCLACHNSGTVTDISLATYARARPWAKAFKEEILEKRMPPYQTTKGFGHFHNDYALTQHEIDQIVSWVEGGAPKGDDKDLPPESHVPGDWLLGPPDLVLQPKSEVNISSGEGDEYRCLTIPTTLKKARWVTAVDFHPGNGAAVHCASFAIDLSPVRKTNHEDRGCPTGTSGNVQDSLGVWVPGQTVVRLPKNVARKLPAGARIVLRIHYHKTAEPVSERSSLGLYFAKGHLIEPLRVVALAALSQDIPAGEERYRLQASYTVSQDAALIAIRPLLFPFGKSVEVTAHRPDGTTEVLIWAKDYRYDWQPEFRFKKSVPLPRGTRIEVTSYLDNSDNNPNNPNRPAREVRFASALCEISMALPVLEARGSSAGNQNEGSRNDSFYVCPMHPEVISDKPGKCPKCAMMMLRTRRPEEAEYEVQLATTPAVVRPGEKFRLTFFITHPKTGARVKEFNIVHDKSFHLFIVSQDLTFFAHIHPQQLANGGFTIDATVPNAGSYLIYCDLFPAGGLPQVVRLNLVAAGFEGDLFSSQARIEPDEILVKSVAGVRFDLKLNPAQPIGGRSAILKYHLTDEKTGENVKDLQPYLGAWGHTLILSEDARDYVHTHPTETLSDSAERTKIFGSSDVSFEAFFPRPGRYRVWSQFQRQDRLITVGFTINVRRL